MPRRVICMARVLGAGGSEVGHLVADALGYQHVDEEIVQQAAASEGVSLDALDDVERRKTFIDKVFRNLALSGGVEGYMAGAAAELAPSLSAISETKSLRALIRKSIEETADRGDVVIVSHAASYALTGRPDVLRVLVTASRQTRLARVVATGSSDEKRAAKMVTQDDAGRAAYLKQFYGVDSESPTHYDLVLNSDSIPIELIADLVVRAASAD
jgi:cytidylate kinase